MKLSTLSLTSLLFIPSLAAAAAVPDAPRQNGTLTKRGGEVNYLANCERVDPEADAYDEQYKYSASYMAWYANIDKSQGQQLPDSLSNEYRDWSRGGTTLRWEGSQQNIYFRDSGVSVQTHIDSDAQSRNVGDWSGWIQRTSDWKTFNCYKDNLRVLFQWGPPVPDGTPYWIDCKAVYYCF